MCYKKMAETEASLEIAVDLSNVAASDHMLVKDVCAVLSTMYKTAGRQGLECIQITSNASVYFAVATFSKGSVVEIAKSDMDTIMQVNPLRIPGISVLHDGEKMHVKVRICSFDHPLTVTDTDIIRIVKKRRWFGS